MPPSSRSRGRRLVAVGGEAEGGGGQSDGERDGAGGVRLQGDRRVAQVGSVGRRREARSSGASNSTAASPASRPTKACAPSSAAAACSAADAAVAFASASGRESGGGCPRRAAEATAAAAAASVALGGHIDLHLRRREDGAPHLEVLHRHVGGEGRLRPRRVLHAQRRRYHLVGRRRVEVAACAAGNAPSSASPSTYSVARREAASYVAARWCQRLVAQRELGGRVECARETRAVGLFDAHSCASPVFESSQR